MRVVSFKIDEDMLYMIETIAKKKGITKSELIRIALRNYLQSSDKKPIVTKRIRIYP